MPLTQVFFAEYQWPGKGGDGACSIRTDQLMFMVNFIDTAGCSTEVSSFSRVAAFAYLTTYEPDILSFLSFNKNIH